MTLDRKSASAKRRKGRYLTKVGQGFWVYGISGYSILGIQYFIAKNWVLGITLVLNFGIKCTALSNVGILHEF